MLKQHVTIHQRYLHANDIDISLYTNKSKDANIYLYKDIYI